MAAAAYRYIPAYKKRWKTYPQSYLFSLTKWVEDIGETKLLLKDREAIRNGEFLTEFRNLSTMRCLKLFSSAKSDLLKLERLMGWPEFKLSTSRKGYIVTPLLSTCVLLWRLSTPSPWHEAESLFGKSDPVLSEIFWEVYHCSLTNIENA